MKTTTNKPIGSRAPSLSHHRPLKALLYWESNQCWGWVQDRRVLEKVIDFYRDTQGIEILDRARVSYNRGYPYATLSLAPPGSSTLREFLSGLGA